MTDAAINPAAPRRRIALLDAARGLAIVAMISYHLTWDLYFTGFSSINAATDPLLRLYAKTIAASFLFLVGVGLALAHGERLHARAFLKRLAIITAAAMLVTVGSWFAFPESFIFFGILHCIALSSVLALPFLRAPVWLRVVCALIVFALPHFAASPVFETPWAWWLGLGVLPPLSNDYVPLLPWFGFVLLATTVPRVAPSLMVSSWRPAGAVGRLLVFAGRHSLLIYLTHQIVLLGLLSGLATLMRP